MKIPTLFFLLCLMLSAGYPGPEPARPDKASVSFFAGDLGYTPLKGNYLYIFRTEVSNRQYLEYLRWVLKYEGRDAWMRCMPDTQVWSAPLTYSEPFSRYYLQHPAYADYPVVGVTRRQALDFCRWSADRIMETPAFRKLNASQIEVRLPSESEWEAAARGDLPADAPWPWPGNDIRVSGGKKRDQGKVMLNVCLDPAGAALTGNMSDPGFITTPVHSYWPNSLGMYNTCGNVAEWVEEGKAKGGSWMQTPWQARIPYSGPVLPDSFRAAHIGFRPVLEITLFRTAQTSAISPDVKAIEKQMLRISDSLYASAFETGNEQFLAFLNRINKPFRALRDMKWAEHTRYLSFRQYPEHPDYRKHPAVNISYDTAKAYCEWLTHTYHQYAGRKYKKVIFRLPTEREWELAASGGIPGSPYPWGGPFVRNSRGAWLCNFHPPVEGFMDGRLRVKDSMTGHLLRETQYRYPGGDSTVGRAQDGAEFMARVDAYYPNPYGLYNCSGNVSEMVWEEGISKGGSWASGYDGIRIQSREFYSEPSCALGFRVFMQVIEY